MPDILEAGATVFMVHLDEDTRGPVRVHDASRVRTETERMLRTRKRLKHGVRHLC